MIKFSLTLFTILFSATVYPHGMRTAYWEVQEQADGTVMAKWQTTVTDPLTRPEYPANCSIETTERTGPSEFQSRLKCDGGIDGQSFSVSGMGTLITETLFQAHTKNAQTTTAVLTSEHDSVEIHASSPWILFFKFISIGMVHILEGWDHLLFLVGLFFLVARRRDLFLACTAFTVAHSITLVATTFGWIHFPSKTAEACIALSLVLLALDIGKVQLAVKQAATIAFVFGLVHGLGFATALSEVGLPQNAIPQSLMGFNLGVELGQLAILLVLSGLCRVIRFEKLLTSLATYSVGVLGSFWLIERVFS